MPGRPGRVHVLRLLPGEDVRATLQSWAHANDIAAAGIVSAVGSLTRAHLRYAGHSTGSEIIGDLELCAFSGTLGRHGLHLHAVVADADGRTRGGHVIDGCLVRTTLELVVQEIDGAELRRTLDPSTGHPELAPRAID